MHIFLFIAAIVSMIAMAAIEHIICKHAKLKVLVTGIAFHPIKGTDRIFGSINNSENCTCKAQWYMIGALPLMIIGLMSFILATTRKCRIFRGHMFSNTVTVILFFSDVKHYVPVKLCKSEGSIHLFKIIGHLTPAQITLKRRLLWDVVQIDWKEVLMTLNGIFVSTLLFRQFRNIIADHGKQTGSVQHSCNGLLKFVLPKNTVSVDLEEMTLTGVHTYKKDKNNIEK